MRLPRPGAGERPVALEHHAGNGLHEQLGDVRRGQPRAVGADDVVDVTRLTGDRDLPGPRQGGSPGLAGFEVGPPVDAHLLLGQPAQHLARQHLLDEQVLLEHQLLAGRRPDGPEEGDRLRWPVVPGIDGRDEGLHVGDRLHRGLVPVRPVEPERRAPVVQDQRHAVAHVEGLEERVEVCAVLDEPVGVRPAVGQLPGVPHPHEVRGDAPAEAAQVRDHVAPLVRGGGVAVQQHDRVAGTLVDVGHRDAVHLDEPLRVPLLGRDHGPPALHGYRRTVRGISAYYGALVTSRDELTTLSDEFWSGHLAAEPTEAHMLGYYPTAGRFEDASRAAEDAEIARLRDVAARADRIDAADLDEQERTTRAVIASQATTTADLLEARLAEVSADPIFGLQDALPLILGMLTLPDAEVADAMPDMLVGAGRWFADVGQRHREGLAHGWAPAAFAVSGTIAQIEGALARPLDDDPFVTALRPPDGIDVDAWRGRLATAVQSRLRPGLATYRDVLRDEVLPQARPDD